MYLSVYLFPIPGDKAADFLRIMKAAGEVYLEHGATGVEVAEGVDLGPAYGCAGLAITLDLREGEKGFIGIDRFRDRSHRDEVMAKVDADPRIDALYEEISDLIGLSRVVRGEFEEVG